MSGLCQDLGTRAVSCRGAWGHQWRTHVDGGPQGERHDGSGFTTTPRVLSGVGGTFGTKREALDAARDEERLVRDGKWIDPEVSGLPFRTYVSEVFMPPRDAGSVSKSTASDNHSIIDTHLLGFFGDRGMDEIQPIHIQQWITNRLEAGTKPARLRKAHALLHSIFESAVRNNVRYENPASHQKGTLPKVTEPGIVTVPEARVQDLFDKLTERDRLVVSLLLDETGMRWSELVGLRVRRVDLDRGVIRVEETCVEVNGKDRERWNFQ